MRADPVDSINFTYPMVCNEITKVVSDMRSIPEYQSTFNTASGCYPDKMILQLVISTLIPRYAEKLQKPIQILRANP